MFFLPNPIHFPIQGTFPDGSENLVLQDSSVELAYQSPTAGTSIDFNIHRVVQVGSQNPIEKQWWTLTPTRTVGNVTFATLTFHAAAFIASALQTFQQPETRTLYDSILAEAQIEIVVEDAAAVEADGSRPATSLLVHLGYGSTTLQFSQLASRDC